LIVVLLLIISADSSDSGWSFLSGKIFERCSDESMSTSS
jgi:hypothetical protein